MSLLRKHLATITTMDFREFQASLEQADPPVLPPLLQALWYDAKGDWERAHEITQDQPGPDAAWVHAYLHRKEGDHSNAGYWYRQAGRPRCSDSLETEWETLARDLLGRP